MGWRGHLPIVKRSDVKAKATSAKTFAELNAEIITCTACPRLVQWREEVAFIKRKAYRDEEYWGRPITGFGSERPRLMIIGLAPGAHGANRTGRIFTGDSSGDWLFSSLHRIGIAKISTSLSKGDGQKLKHTRITTAVRCAPPDNSPDVDERDTCAPWLVRECELALPTTRAFVALGAFAWSALFRTLRHLGHPITPVKFGHGAELRYRHEGKEFLLIASYHPSQQNTFTGKLTQEQLDFVLEKAGRFAHAID